MVSKRKTVTMAVNGAIPFKCGECDAVHTARLRAFMAYEGESYALDTAGNWSEVVKDGRLFVALNEAFEKETGLPVIEETIQ
jgi:hypothetical protein